MLVTSANEMRCVDVKTLQSKGSIGKDKKTGEYIFYMPYVENGESKIMVHKKFRTEQEATDYMAQFVTRYNKAHYSDEKVLKVLFYKKE